MPLLPWKNVFGEDVGNHALVELLHRLDGVKALLVESGRDLGSRFTFQDFMGAGVLVGGARTIALGVKVNHYSNGNVFPENAGVMVPVTFTAGWAF